MEINTNMTHHTPLHSAEIAQLWNTYMMDTLAICMLTYFGEKVEDAEIKDFIQYSITEPKHHISVIKEIFQKENFPIPQGFTEKDINLSAPKLFSDVFVLYYLWNVTKFVLNAHGIAKTLCTRSDVNTLYKNAIGHASELDDLIKTIALRKGVYVKPPYIPVPEKTDFIKEPSYLAGFLGEQRALNAMEITNLYNAIATNNIGKMLIMGFSQVAQSKKIRHYFLKGKSIASNHINLCSDLLRKEDIPAPEGWDVGVTNSTVPPFSDKLMLFHITTLNASGITNYAMSIASSARRDISLLFTRLSAEIAKFAEEGANLMIHNGWLEEPPQAPNRKALVRQ
ncbi:DUF3231 family protein [Ammoniphilus sp. YIM 78166]|uniref:DUF3231 family protein n=1 Tax=Ammoniphilus sp. YIM 78166 TaxID=1644106 RepID=UPI00106FFAC5|nr:DUF3231 family protein [Ammoniphilus sp. YIM 78166]